MNKIKVYKIVIMNPSNEWIYGIAPKEYKVKFTRVYNQGNEIRKRFESKGLIVSSLIELE
jgi:hypothetical protein